MELRKSELIRFGENVLRIYVSSSTSLLGILAFCRGTIIVKVRRYQEKIFLPSKFPDSLRVFNVLEKNIVAHQRLPKRARIRVRSNAQVCARVFIMQDLFVASAPAESAQNPKGRHDDRAPSRREGPGATAGRVSTLG